MDHYERPAFCPDCGVPCVMEITVAQERENSCPQCGKTFTDFSEQFQGNYVGVLSEEHDPASPPYALFLDEEVCKAFMTWLADHAPEALRESLHFPTRSYGWSRSSVYGVVWNGADDDDPWKDKFQPFIPDDLVDEGLVPRNQAADVTVVGEHEDWHASIRMIRQAVTGQAPIYFCEQTQRWYLFYLDRAEKPRYSSINDGPTNFARAHLSGIVQALNAGGLVTLTWEEFEMRDGRISPLVEQRQGG